MKYGCWKEKQKHEDTRKRSARFAHHLRDRRGGPPLRHRGGGRRETGRGRGGEGKSCLVVFAGGSNVLLPDEGLDALVVCVESDDVSFLGNALEAEAGCNLAQLIHHASERGLGGWEKLAGIPG